MDSRLSDLEDENNELKTIIKNLQQDLAKHREIIALQQECLFKGKKIQDHQQCLECGKIFVNNSFLQSHLKRRHLKLTAQDEASTETFSGEKESNSVSTQTQTGANLSQDTLMTTSTINDSVFDEDRTVKRSKSLPALSLQYYINNEESVRESRTPGPTLSRKPSFKKKISSIGKKFNKSLRKMSFKKK